MVTVRYPNTKFNWSIKTVWTLSPIFALFHVFRRVTFSTNLTNDVGFNGHIHLFVSPTCASKVPHSSGNTVSEISFPCRQELE
jgi:hypothetical protein